MVHVFWRVIGTTRSLIPWDDTKSNPKSSDAKSNSRGVNWTEASLSSSCGGGRAW